LEAHIGIPLDSIGEPLAHDILIRDDYFSDAVNAVCETNKIKLLDLEGHPDVMAKVVEDPPTRCYGDKPHSCVMCPIQPTTHNGVVAILIVGVNSRRPYDADYDSFVKGLARTVSTALASVLLVNEQKRLAGKAAEMEERAMAMVEVSPVGSFLMDMNGQMLYVNDSVRLTLGFVSENVY
jgi:PAS domain-containing protein